MYLSEDKLWWYISLRDLLKYYIKKYAVNAPRILDAGCGTGKNMEFMLSLGYEHVEGLDYSPDAIKFCLKRGLSNVRQSSITKMGYKDNSFDVVYCMDVLGSLDILERQAATAELFRVLKPGGLFICNSAALEVFRSPHDEVSNIKLRFNRKQFQALFKAYEAGIKKISYRVFLLSPLVLLFKAGKQLLNILWPNRGPHSDQIIFPLGINWLFTQVQMCENFILKRLNLPFGSSVFIVVIK